MAFQQINWLADLERMARGEKPKAEPWLVAELAVKWAKAGLEVSEVGQLDRLYRLEDPRSSSSR